MNTEINEVTIDLQRTKIIILPKQQEVMWFDKFGLGVECGSLSAFQRAIKVALESKRRMQGAK